MSVFTPIRTDRPMRSDIDRSDKEWSSKGKISWLKSVRSVLVATNISKVPHMEHRSLFDKTQRVAFYWNINGVTLSLTS